MPLSPVVPMHKFCDLNKQKILPQAERHMSAQSDNIYIHEGERGMDAA